MTEKVADIIKSALQEINVQASEAPIEADEAQTAILYLNRMMFKFAAQGINLGYTKVSNLADDVTVADGAMDGIVKNLALSLQPQFTSEDTPINPLLVQQAKEGLDVMRQLSVFSIGPSFFPSTLPVGSGNEDDTGLGADRFYTEPQEQIETEQGGFISVETNTELP
jgi:hypothetical protein